MTSLAESVQQLEGAVQSIEEAKETLDDDSAHLHDVIRAAQRLGGKDVARLLCRHPATSQDLMMAIDIVTDEIPERAREDLLEMRDIELAQRRGRLPGPPVELRTLNEHRANARAASFELSTPEPDAVVEWE